MANVAIQGLQAAKVIGGGTVTYTRARVLTNNTTAIFRFDTVVYQTGGDVIVQGTGTTLTGNVANGCIYTDVNSVRREAKYLPAATLYTSTGVAPDNASYVYIVEDPLRVFFRASVDAAIALTDLNLNYAITLTAGSTTSGMSAFELTATGRAVTATIPIRVREFVLGPDTDQDAAHASVICQINAGQAEPALSASLGT